MPGELAAVVVNHNAGDHLTNCVRSLREAGITDVVVVDNASSDGSLAALITVDADARVVQTGANLGYGGGANRGLAVTKSADCVLVLNADVVVDVDSVRVLEAAIEAAPDVGIVAPCINEVDGALYPSARTFPTLSDAVGHAFLGLRGTDNAYSRRYLMTDWDHATARDVEWVSGACFLARRQAIDAVRGFDEAYFMYLEDVDLCWRLGRAGWRVRYEPGAHVIHVQGVSTAQTPYRMLAAHHESLFRFWWRTSSAAGRVLAPLVAAGLLVRLALMSVRRALLVRGRN